MRWVGLLFTSAVIRATGVAQDAGVLPTIQVPAGFVVERVAAPPLVEHPVMAGFDERGRLFVAEPSGENLEAAALLKKLPGRILRFEDTDGDGRFDRRTVFADKLTFPMGALWHDGAFYVCAAPSLWKFVDTKGDGVADKREELVTKFGFSGNAADIHGPFLSPDGRLYWTDGRHGHEIRRADGSMLKGEAARIFRCRPDGRDVEVVCGGGMDDPVEIAFTEEGEALATVDLFEAQPRRVDALIHCIEGGAFPWNEVVREFRRTGDLLPPVADLGWVAPAGLMRARGAAYRDSWFVALFNAHKIQRLIVTRDGATFRARVEDFLVSSDPDFHPTDVLEDADGSLLVVDTGGWFRIGCPSSKIAKPQVFGGIYRIRRKDVAPVADPRGLKIKWERQSARELVTLLDDARFVVRDRAIESLAKLGAKAIAPLRETLQHSKSVQQRRNAVWTLSRLDGDGARLALADADASVQLAALHTVGLYRDAKALPQLLVSLKSENAAIRREAATALGRIRAASAVPALLEALRASNDRFAEHAIIYALIEIAARDATLAGLRDTNSSTRRGALIALDQMDGGNLTPDQVTPLLASSDPALQQAALNVITARPTWAKEIFGLTREWLGATELDEMGRENLRGVIVAFCQDTAIQELVAQALRETKTTATTRLVILEAMAQAPLERVPAIWAAELRWSLNSGDERVMRQAVVTMRAARVGDFDDALLRLAKDGVKSEELRVEALAAAAPRLEQVEPWAFSFLRDCLAQEKPVLIRLTAAQALGAATLDDKQLTTLASRLGGIGAFELPKLLVAFERSKDAAVGKKLVAALEKSPALESLSADSLRQALKNYPREVQRQAEPLVKRLSADVEAQRARLKELEPVLTGGDAGLGREIFFGKKAGCAACHTVAAQGGRVGPDLSKIGAIRSGHDLLEAIVFPSASFVRGFEPYVVRTREGEIENGILARETAEAVYLYGADRIERRIPRDAIESLQPSPVSIMPQGLDAQLSRDELADLIAFLLSLK